MRATSGRADRGSATVLLLAVVVVALVLALAVVALSRAATARGTAQGAADLAAIAGAEAALLGSGDPCGRATQVARVNGGAVTRCAVAAGGFVEVEVAVAVEPWPRWRTTASASARAGPVTGR